MLKRKKILKFLKSLSLALTFVSIFLISSCTNPFAPRLVHSIADTLNVADQTTVSGVFENFRYAYMFKDTIVYGNLLSEDFTFTYHDYDIGIMKAWGREEEMLTTSGLFSAAQSLDLIWNEVTVSAATPDSLINDISRGFTLSIVFSASDAVKVQGRANLRLKRKSIGDIWKIILWKDESNY